MTTLQILAASAALVLIGWTVTAVIAWPLAPDDGGERRIVH